MTPYTVELDYDSDAECPSEWGGWKVISFNQRHVNFEDPYLHLGPPDAFGEPVPKTLGLRRRLATGTAFILSCYVHSGTAWSLKGEGMQCQWDTARIAGLLLWQGKVKDLSKGYADRQKSARNFLRTYNAWCNGEVYRFAITRGAEEIAEADNCYNDDGEMFAEIAYQLPPGAAVVYTGEAAWLAKSSAELASG